MNDEPAVPKETPLSEEELIEIRRAYHSLEAFQLSPEHREAKAALKTRLAEGETQKQYDRNRQK